MLTGVEYENYDYQAIIQRSSGAVSAYPIDFFDPVYAQPLQALTRTPTNDKENLKTYAAFVQDQVSLTERLRVLAGARFEAATLGCERPANRVHFVSAQARLLVRLVPVTEHSYRAWRLCQPKSGAWVITVFKKRHVGVGDK